MRMPAGTLTDTLAISEMWFNRVLRHLPDRVGDPARTRWLKRNCSRFGPGSRIAEGSRVLDAQRLEVGARVMVARDVTLDARNDLRLDDEALIGFEALLLTFTHKSSEVGIPVQDQGFEGSPIVIGRRAWVGARVIILPGVVVGADSIIAAGSVVTREVQPSSVVGGVPAKQISVR